MECARQHSPLLTLTTMSFDCLYDDVFHSILDYLELDDIARLSGVNREAHAMCTDYVPMVSEFTLNTLQYRHCLHQKTLPSLQTPEPCRKVDKSSVEHGYCKEHMGKHVCWDCGTVRKVLDKVVACADGEACCYKWVCCLEDGGCVALECWSCLSYYDVISMYKYSGVEKDLLCNQCVQEHDVADMFLPCVTWYGRPYGAP